jgi:hypothetical protein
MLLWHWAEMVVIMPVVRVVLWALQEQVLLEHWVVVELVQPAPCN